MSRLMLPDGFEAMAMANRGRLDGRQGWGV